MRDLVNKIRRKWMKLRLQPIRVLCLHHVSEVFDDGQMHECDWMSTEEFKEKIKTLQQEGVEFISLPDAHRHISNDYMRKAKYAVLTFDDGWASLKNIIPWVCKQHIPVTLFINPAYTKGEDKREIGTSLTQQELEELLTIGESNIQIASHGWNHTLCTELTIQEFEKSVNQSDAYLKKYNAYIPYFAYPCGRRANGQDEFLLAKGIVPVYMDGELNYREGKVIHRELI